MLQRNTFRYERMCEPANGCNLVRMIADWADAGRPCQSVEGRLILIKLTLQILHHAGKIEAAMTPSIQILIDFFRHLPERDLCPCCLCGSRGQMKIF